MKTTTLSTLDSVTRVDLEGILVQALAKLTVLPGYTDQTPDDVLNSCYGDFQVIMDKLMPPAEGEETPATSLPAERWDV